jgi:hypothetical protein
MVDPQRDPSPADAVKATGDSAEPSSPTKPHRWKRSHIIAALAVLLSAAGLFWGICRGCQADETEYRDRALKYWPRLEPAGELIVDSGGLHVYSVHGMTGPFNYDSMVVRAHVRVRNSGSDPARVLAIAQMEAPTGRDVLRDYLLGRPTEAPIRTEIDSGGVFRALEIAPSDTVSIPLNLTVPIRKGLDTTVVHVLLLYENATQSAYYDLYYQSRLTYPPRSFTVTFAKKTLPFVRSAYSNTTYHVYTRSEARRIGAYIKKQAGTEISGDTRGK